MTTDTLSPTESLLETFQDRGYVLLREILDTAAVGRARALCSAELTGSGSEEMCGSRFLNVPELARIPVHPRIVAAVRELMPGNIRLYPSYTARKNVYVPWHVDDAFVGAGKEYVWEADFLHIQGGLYLQDNSTTHGGGVDVIRGSHLMSFDGYGKTAAEFDIAGKTLGTSSLRETVDLKAGDVILWNARLMHASTPVRVARLEEKFGVFFGYGRDDLASNNRFLSHLVASRVRTMNGISGVVPRLAEVADVRYPASFPRWFLEAAETVGVKLATL